jgi:hypothetical protein
MSTTTARDRGGVVTADQPKPPPTVLHGVGREVPCGDARRPGLLRRVVEAVVSRGLDAAARRGKQ